MDFWRMPLDAADQAVTLSKVNILAYRCKGCRYCIEFCPQRVLAEAAEFNEKGYHPPYVTEGADCKDCRYCESVCPEFAIFVTDEGAIGIGAKDVLPKTKTQTRTWRRRREK